MKFIDLLNEEAKKMMTISGKNVNMYLNPDKDDIKFLNAGDRGFLLNDGTLIMCKNTGYIFHLTIWQSIKETIKKEKGIDGGYTSLIEEGTIFPLQMGDNKEVYLSEQYDVDKISIDAKTLKNAVSKSKSPLKINLRAITENDL